MLIIFHAVVVALQEKEVRAAVASAATRIVPAAPSSALRAIEREKAEAVAAATAGANQQLHSVTAVMQEFLATTDRLNDARGRPAAEVIRGTAFGAVGRRRSSIIGGGGALPQKMMPYVHFCAVSMAAVACSLAWVHVCVCVCVCVCVDMYVCGRSSGR